MFPFCVWDRFADRLVRVVPAQSARERDGLTGSAQENVKAVCKLNDYHLYEICELRPQYDLSYFTCVNSERDGLSLGLAFLGEKT